jgi:hypothetical protein
VKQVIGARPPCEKLEEEMNMKYEFKRYVWAASLVLGLPLLALAALTTVPSDFGTNGKFDWFTVGTKTGTDIEHTIAYGINDDGVAVGTYEEEIIVNGASEHGFVTKDKGKHIRTINYPGACDTDAGAINDEGVIAGTFEQHTGAPGPCDGPSDDLAFKYEDGKFKKLDVPTTAKFKTTKTICDADGGTYDAAKKTCAVSVSGLDVRGISDDNDVVGGFTVNNAPGPGDLGFTFSEGKLRVLEVCNEAAISSTPEGCSPGTTDGWGVNDHYAVVGHYEDHNVNNLFCEFDPEDGTVCEPHHHGFIWTKKGEEGSFKKLYCDGDVNSNTDVNGFNNKGVAVGRCDSVAFVLFPPYGNSDWHTFTIPDPASGKFRCPTGSELNKTIAWGISNEDKIVGQYVCEGGGTDKSYSFEVKVRDVVN